MGHQALQCFQTCVLSVLFGALIWLKGTLIWLSLGKTKSAVAPEARDTRTPTDIGGVGSYLLIICV